MKIGECLVISIMVPIIILLVFMIAFSEGKTEEPKAPREFQVETVYEFKYKKHSYIGFPKYKGWGVVHNPDCEYCKEVQAD